MSEEERKRGGARPGSGKKRESAGELIKPTSIGLTDPQREKLKRLGGAPWVRGKIDKAKLPKE